MASSFYVSLSAALILVFGVSYLVYFSWWQQSQTTDSPVTIFDLLDYEEPVIPIPNPVFTSPLQRIVTREDIQQYLPVRAIIYEKNCPQLTGVQKLPVIAGDMKTYCDHVNRMLCDQDRDVPATDWMIIMLANGFVAGSYCHGDVFGQPFNHQVYLQFSMSSLACAGVPPPVSSINFNNAIEYDELGSTIYMPYPSANGHFATQTLPKILLLLNHLPSYVPILVPSGGLADKFRTFMVDNKMVDSALRLVPYQPGQLYRANRLYFADYVGLNKVDESQTRCSLLEVRNAFKHLVVSRSGYTAVWIRRKGSRRVLNEEALLEALKKRFSFLEITVFTENHSIGEAIQMFGEASLIVGPHGAGFFNIMWNVHNAPVIELAYETGMPTPPMYFDIARFLGHTYHTMLCQGDYGGELNCNVDTFRLLLEGVRL